jgi:hypothetical protein
MDALSAAQIVRIWERGTARPPAERALAILAEVDPDPAGLPDLPIGVLATRLLALREATFGPRFAAVTRCEQCGERLDLEFTATDVRRAGDRDEPPAAAVRVGEIELHVRPLTSRDLLAATACADAGAARLALARRAISDAIDVEPLAPDLLPALAHHLEALDPDAARTLALSCPACAAQHDHDFDVAAFFWGEIENEALRLLRDVHAIARTYGWGEAEILEMSPLRRRAYLELALG